LRCFTLANGSFVCLQNVEGEGIQMFRSGRTAAQTIVALAILLLAATVIFAQKKEPPTTPVDLNVANIKELEQLPGVGATTAKAIIDFRTKSGRFHRVEDLLVIRGISEAKLKKMRPYITVGPPPAAKPAPVTKPSTPPKKPAPTGVQPPASTSSH
jgi:competence ComEA-like helix-hairpin-helix protein